MSNEEILEAPKEQKEDVKEGHEKILSIIMDENEITWQTIIYELVNSEEMDPWNVNVSLLTAKYIDTIKSLQELDFRLSGKVLLAAAILLKIKSNKWIKEDIANLDALFSSAEDDVDELLDGIEDEDYYRPNDVVDAQLIPRTPQPRKRKVSVYDLVNALEKALEVKHRRVLRDIPALNVEAPKKKRDISEIIKDIYLKVKTYFNTNPGKLLTFSQIIPSTSKEDKVFTFIPLLHLTNQRRIDINQPEHFGEIEIMLRSKAEVDKELAVDT